VTVELTTERLNLTPLVPADAEALFAYRSLPDVTRFQTWEPRSVDDAAVFLSALEGVEFDTPGTWFQLGIHERGSGRLIGDLGVHVLEDGRQVEIGFTLDPAFQRRGLGAEAVVGLLDHLFGSLGKHRVFASVDPRNAASVHLLERVGMRREAHFRQSLLFKGEWTDDVVFAVLASEWSDRA